MTEANSTVHSLSDTDAPRTATKPAGRKRGRKGDKISIAFKELPTTPINSIKFSESKKIPAEAVNFEDYAESHGIGTSTLRQLSRHDSYGVNGKAHLRKDKVTHKLMIWREHK